MNSMPIRYGLQRMEARRGMSKKDQAEHRNRIFAGRWLGVGAQLVNRLPQVIFK